MHGLIFLVNMTFSILMVSFPPHSAGSSFRMHGLIFLVNMTFTILMVSFPLHSAGIFTFIIMSMRLSSFMSFSFHSVGISISVTVLVSMRLASFMSFPLHSASVSAWLRIHNLSFLLTMTFAIRMVSFSLHPVLVLVTGMIGMMGMTVNISFISFYMGMIMNYISMVMMGVTMLMNSSVSMSVSIASNMSFSLHPVTVLVTGMIGRMRMTIN